MSVPGALWLAQYVQELLRMRAFARVALLVWPLVIFVAWPPFRDRHLLPEAAARNATLAAPADAAVLKRLKPGEVAITSFYWPNGDARYYDEVQFYVTYTPRYPYRFLPVGGGVDWAARTGLRPAYYLGFDAPTLDTIELGSFGRFRVERLPESELAVRLVPLGGG
jgi:hypothetical protein